MAEALLRKHAGDRFEAASAGFEPTDAHPLTREVLAEVGIDERDLSVEGLRGFLAKRAVRHAIIVCAQAEKQCPKIYLFAAETSYWAFDDPTALEGSPELQRAEVQRVRDEIDERMARRCAASTPSTRRSARTARTRAQP
jgi:arsenate reductase